MKKKIRIVVVAVILIVAVIVLGVKNDKDGIEGFIETSVVSYYSEVSGTVADVKVALGQEVKKGDVILVIDDSDARYKVLQLEQNLAKQQIALAQLESSYDYELIMQGINQVTVMEESCQGAQEKFFMLKEEYEDVKVLYDAGAVSEDSLNDVKHQLSLAESNYNSLLAQLDTARQQLSLKQGSQGSDSQKEIAKASLIQAASELEKAKNDLEKYTIRADNDGRVLSLSYRKGGVVTLGSPVVDLAVTEENYWVGYVPVELLGKLEYDKEVEIKSDSSTEKAVVCYIDVKSQYASEEYANSTNRDKETVKVKCLLKEDTSFKPGQTATLSIK